MAAGEQTRLIDRMDAMVVKIEQFNQSGKIEDSLPVKNITCIKRSLLDKCDMKYAKVLKKVSSHHSLGMDSFVDLRIRIEAFQAKVARYSQFVELADQVNEKNSRSRTFEHKRKATRQNLSTLSRDPNEFKSPSLTPDDDKICFITGLTSDAENEIRGTSTPVNGYLTRSDDESSIIFCDLETSFSSLNSSGVPSKENLDARNHRSIMNLSIEMGSLESEDNSAIHENSQTEEDSEDPLKCLVRENIKNHSNRKLQDTASHLTIVSAPTSNISETSVEIDDCSHNGIATDESSSALGHETGKHIPFSVSTFDVKEVFMPSSRCKYGSRKYGFVKQSVEPTMVKDSLITQATEDLRKCDDSEKQQTRKTTRSTPSQDSDIISSALVEDVLHGRGDNNISNSNIVPEQTMSSLDKDLSIAVVSIAHPEVAASVTQAPEQISIMSTSTEQRSVMIIPEVNSTTAGTKTVCTKREALFLDKNGTGSQIASLGAPAVNTTTPEDGNTSHELSTSKKRPSNASEDKQNSGSLMKTSCRSALNNSTLESRKKLSQVKRKTGVCMRSVSIPDVHSDENTTISNTTHIMDDNSNIMSKGEEKSGYQVTSLSTSDVNSLPGDAAFLQKNKTKSSKAKQKGEFQKTNGTIPRMSAVVPDATNMDANTKTLKKQSKKSERDQDLNAQTPESKQSSSQLPTSEKDSARKEQRECSFVVRKSIAAQKLSSVSLEKSVVHEITVFAKFSTSKEWTNAIPVTEKTASVQEVSMKNTEANISFSESEGHGHHNEKTSRRKKWTNSLLLDKQNTHSHESNMCKLHTNSLKPETVIDAVQRSDTLSLTDQTNPHISSIASSKSSPTVLEIASNLDDKKRTRGTINPPHVVTSLSELESITTSANICMPAQEKTKRRRKWINRSVLAENTTKEKAIRDPFEVSCDEATDNNGMKQQSSSSISSLSKESTRSHKMEEMNSDEASTTTLCIPMGNDERMFRKRKWSDNLILLEQSTSLQELNTTVEDDDNLAVSADLVNSGRKMKLLSKSSSLAERTIINQETSIITPRAISAVAEFVTHVESDDELSMLRRKWENISSTLQNLDTGGFDTHTVISEPSSSVASLTEDRLSRRKKKIKTASSAEWGGNSHRKNVILESNKDIEEDLRRMDGTISDINYAVCVDAANDKKIRRKKWTSGSLLKEQDIIHKETSAPEVSVAISTSLEVDENVSRRKKWTNLSALDTNEMVEMDRVTAETEATVCSMVDTHTGDKKEKTDPKTVAEQIADSQEMSIERLEMSTSGPESMDYTDEVFRRKKINPTSPAEQSHENTSITRDIPKVDAKFTAGEETAEKFSRRKKWISSSASNKLTMTEPKAETLSVKAVEQVPLQDESFSVGSDTGSREREITIKNGMNTDGSKNSSSDVGSSSESMTLVQPTSFHSSSLGQSVGKKQSLFSTSVTPTHETIQDTSHKEHHHNIEIDVTSPLSQSICTSSSLQPIAIQSTCCLANHEDSNSAHAEEDSNSAQAVIYHQKEQRPSHKKRPNSSKFRFKFCRSYLKGLTFNLQCPKFF